MVHFIPCPTKNNANRIFGPKTTKFGPKLAFLVNLGQAMQAYSVPCWWVGWWLWRAGCISQDTYLLYFTKSKKTVFYTSPKADSERGDADGKSEVSSGADNLGFEGQQPTSANERVNLNATHFSGSIVSLAKFFNRVFIIALFEF